jgi:hypothetical protein
VGRARARERESEGDHGPKSTQPRGRKVFPFSIFFLFFSLIHFLLYTNIHLYFLGSKMKCYV